MAINKVEYGQKTLIDLTSDTVTKETLVKGTSAHNAAGERIEGVFDPAEYLKKTDDGSNLTVAFTEKATRENISTGEKMSVLMGKIKKFFADLTAPAFAQMITTKEDLLATKVTGYVPDAKAVADTYTELNGKLANIPVIYPDTATVTVANGKATLTHNLNITGNYSIQVMCTSNQNVVFPYTPSANSVGLAFYDTGMLPIGSGTRTVNYIIFA